MSFYHIIVVMKINTLKEKTGAFKDLGSSAKEYLKGTFTERFGEKLPDITVGATYAAFDTFGIVNGMKTLRDFIETEIVQNQQYFDFSDAPNTLISLGKIGLTAAAFGFGYSTIKSIADYISDRRNGGSILVERD